MSSNVQSHPADAPLPLETVARRILVLRGQKVLLDADLAALHGVTTKRFNEQIKRNLARFPADFMFRLDAAEFENLRSHFATSSAEPIQHGARARTAKMPDRVRHPGTEAQGEEMKRCRKEISTCLCRTNPTPPCGNRRYRNDNITATLPGACAVEKGGCNARGTGPFWRDRLRPGAKHCFAETLGLSVAPN